MTSDEFDMDVSSARKAAIEALNPIYNKHYTKATLEKRKG